jgi:hypothetical protein
MAFEIEYFHERVLAEIESWPVDVLADYALPSCCPNTDRAFACRTPAPSAMDCLN